MNSTGPRHSAHLPETVPMVHTPAMSTRTGKGQHAWHTSACTHSCAMLALTSAVPTLPPSHFPPMPVSCRTEQPLLTSTVLELPMVSDVEVVRPRLRSCVRLLSVDVVSSTDSWREKVVDWPEVTASDQVDASAVPKVSCLLSLRCLVTESPSATSSPALVPWDTTTPVVWPVAVERSRATCKDVLYNNARLFWLWLELLSATNKQAHRRSLILRDKSCQGAGRACHRTRASHPGGRDQECPHTELFPFCFVQLGVATVHLLVRGMHSQQVRRCRD